ncbi:DUF5716 family protein [Lachnospiraceae bacterium 42-17]|jgi:hypothetical protein|nr:hypothetical protein [Dorea sp.]
MKKGYILGYDMNDKNCQISFYDGSKDEPETLQVSADNYQIPLVIGYFQERWIYGKEAKRLATVSLGYTVTDLFERAVRRERVRLGERIYDAVWLLAKYVELSLESFEDIEFITFSTPETDIDMSKMLKGIGQHLGIPKSHVCVQDYKESFCQYMMFQPKELWQYESALFFCDEQRIKAYMLRKLNVDAGHVQGTFVTVDEVANAHMKELEALYPIISEEKAKDADVAFKAMIENIFEKKVVSSVYLTGEGFENSWYPNSQKVLCNGRRAFLGNNLYSKGACYTSIRKCADKEEGPIYLDESKLMDRICLRMRVHGQEGWYPIVSWGEHWYEADGQWEVLLEELSDIEILIESLSGEEMQVEKVSLEGMPARNDYSMRMQVEVMFLDEKTCKLTFKDIGFGEFFPATDFQVEKVIGLGGTNGQFNSMS